MQWTQELQTVLSEGFLSLGYASKWFGRFAFLNTHLFNRLGWALLRPHIWRQAPNARQRDVKQAAQVRLDLVFDFARARDLPNYTALPICVYANGTAVF